jgi:4-hydroxy-tetrahydrodipicolinate reductase
MNPRIALIGYGQMGREIHHLALESGASISTIIDPNVKEYALPLTAETLRNTDVCIECTSPDVAVKNIHHLAALKKDMVIGTTGWTSQLDDVRDVVMKNNVGLLYASNFSIGMQLFIRIVSAAAKLFGAYDSYDVAVHETHHRLKKDAPSGTALTLAHAILESFPEKTTIVTGNKEGSFQTNELHVSSQRLGAVPGIHSVIFDGAADTVELRHTIRNRRGLAEGALLAARWIHGKKGIFTIEDMINDVESL